MRLGGWRLEAKVKAKGVRLEVGGKRIKAEKNAVLRRFSPAVLRSCSAAVKYGAAVRAVNILI